MRRVDRQHLARALTVTALALTVPLALAACGSEQSGGLKPGQRATAKSGTALTIEVKASRNAEPERYTLTCGDAGAGGSHPNPAQACAALEKAQKPFAPVPGGVACTEIFGGDQTATIRGTWQGEKVDASYSRSNGCEIDRWNAIAEVFPGKVGI